MRASWRRQWELLRRALPKKSPLGSQLERSTVENRERFYESERDQVATFQARIHLLPNRFSGIAQRGSLFRSLPLAVL